MEKKYNPRLFKEIQDLQNQKDQGIDIIVDEKNVGKLTIIIVGPQNTPYVGGKFALQCDIPNEYPFKPPLLIFQTKIYHPNVKKDTGEICKDIYQQDWTPVKKIITVIDQIKSMIVAPNLESPIEIEIAEQFKKNKTQFDEIAIKWTQEFAQ